MKQILTLFLFDGKRRAKSSFTIGYQVIFPIIMILLLGYLLSGQFNEGISSYTYYTLVMLPFCTMMAVITSAYAGIEESYTKTAYRLLVSPVDDTHIFFSKLLSCGVTFSCCNILVLLGAKFLFHISMGVKLWYIIALLVSETFCVCAIGLYIGLGMKNFVYVKNFLNLPIFIFAIVGGSFTPMGSSDKLLRIVFQLSPLTWINRSIFLSLYDSNESVLWITVLILWCVCVLFVYVGIRSFRREDFIDGDLLGFKK